MADEWDTSAFIYDPRMDQNGIRRVYFWVFLILSLLLFSTAIAWAARADLDEVTRGQGRVIPSGKIQVVQSLEGGIIEEIPVSVGQLVSKGDILLKIDDTGFAADLGELEARKYGLDGKIARLNAEITGRGSISFAEDIMANAPGIVSSEQALFRSRRTMLENSLRVLRSRKEQRRQERSELEGKVNRLKNELDIARQNLDMNLGVQDIIPRSEILNLRKEVSTLEGEISTTRSGILRADAAINEADQLIASERSNFREQAQSELTDARSELNILDAGTQAADDRVDRAELRAPVDGIINEIHVNTVGGVVQPGKDLIEIVPASDNLLIEARIRPKDIAFLTPNQQARVSITAYDFSIYGSLDGVVERIGADSLTDEQSGETYFPIDIRTEIAKFEKDGKTLPVVPGMVASVDIITGRKTVLQYLLKPVNKAKYEGLRER